MSIALSAIIKPSRYFALIYLGFSACFAVTGILMVTGYVGQFILYGKELLVLFFSLIALFMVFNYFRSRKTLRIDISGNGQIRLKEYSGNELKIPEKIANPSENIQKFKLIENSTIWPRVLFLRLKSETGIVSSVTIFSDSVREDEFKSLYIAFRWIEAHRKELI